MARTHAGAGRMRRSSQRNVADYDREPYASPDHALTRSDSQVLPARHSKNDADLQKDQRHGKTAGHPLPMLLDFALANESERNASCEHEQSGIDRGSHKN